MTVSQFHGLQSTPGDSSDKEESLVIFSSRGGHSAEASEAELLARFGRLLTLRDDFNRCICQLRFLH